MVIDIPIIIWLIKNYKVIWLDWVKDNIIYWVGIWEKHTLNSFLKNYIIHKIKWLLLEWIERSCHPAVWLRVYMTLDLWKWQWILDYKIKVCLSGKILWNQINCLILHYLKVLRQHGRIHFIMIRIKYLLDGIEKYVPNWNNTM